MMKRKNKELTKRKKYKAYSHESKNPHEKPESFFPALIKLLKQLKSHKLMLALIIITGIIGTAMSITGPLLLGDVINAIQTQVENKLAAKSVDLSPIVKILFTILGIYAVSSLMTYVQQYTMAGVAQKVVCSLREQVNKKLSRIPLKYFDLNSKGNILSKIVNDIDNINHTLQNNLIQIITSTVTFVGILGIMFYVSWKMTLITLSILPISALIASFFAGKSKRYFRQQWDRTGELNGHIEEMYTGHKIVKVFGHEKNAIDEFDDINDELYVVSRKAQFISGLLMPFFSFINNFVYVMICISGGIFIMRGSLTLGAITSFITYSKLFLQPLVEIANIMNNLQSSLASTERVFKMLSEEDQAKDKNLPFKNNSGTVVFDNISFSYDENKPLIENMNLNVESGQLIAIVGPTGAGKTTLVNLLMRFYELKSGAIYVNDTDIRDVSREDLRNALGMVLQDTWLFSGTIRENIAYGKSDATEDEIISAAKNAKVHHFIQTLSEGYDTILEEEGTNISQGQRQLLTIARAILADPKILILDEATSSVDTRTEIQIQKAMKNLMKGRTNFVIAHRLSTIREADNILVIDNGAIVEQGNHEELMNKNGFYFELYNSQFSTENLS